MELGEKFLLLEGHVTMKQHPTNPPPKLVTPLEHMLGVLNDPTAAPNRKDRMAIAAAPYCHARLVEPAKRDQRAEAARSAGGRGTPWEGDLGDDDSGWADDLEYADGPLRQ
jgi:hypothetical protein